MGIYGRRGELTRLGLWISGNLVSEVVFEGKGGQCPLHVTLTYLSILDIFRAAHNAEEKVRFQDVAEE